MREKRQFRNIAKSPGLNFIEPAQIEPGAAMC